MAKITTQIPSTSNGLHNDLMGLNEGDYQHLTELEKSNLEYISNKQNSLDQDPSNTKYPTVNAVIVGDNDTLASANQYTDSKISSVYKYKGSVSTYTSLPATGNIIGDVWNVLDTDINYAWTGTVWDSLGGTTDISGKEDKINKQNSLTSDGTGTKYPTVDAVNTGLNNKLDKGGYTGNAQNLKTDIDAIYQSNVLISSVTPTRVSNTFTYSALGVEALINKVRYKNPTAYSTTITPAANDFKRVDVIYIGVGGMMGTQMGTEVSTTVAPVPDTPANTVVVGNINIFGNTISPPIPVDNEISIQDSFGLELFKINNDNPYIRYKGMTAYPNEKLLEVNALSSNSVYVSTSGNDAIAELENSKKPFLTLDKAIEAIKTKQAVGLNWKIVFLTPGTFEVNNTGSFAWWVETELAVSIVFKYAQCEINTYSIFKGTNLNLIFQPSVVANTFSILSGYNVVIDWDFNKIEVKAVSAGQPIVNRIIYFELVFIKQIRIRQINQSDNNFASIMTIENPLVDYNIQISNHSTNAGVDAISNLFTLANHNVLNSSITVLNSNTFANFNIFNGYCPAGVLIRIGNLTSTGWILLQAYNIEFLKGIIQNLVIRGAQYLKGKASITYNVNYNSTLQKISVIGPNRNTGISCFWSDLDLTFIEGTQEQFSFYGLVNLFETNTGLELNNVSMRVVSANWSPDIFIFIIPPYAIGQALQFKGDCNFDCKAAIIGYRDGHFGTDADSIDLATITEAKNRGILKLISGTISSRYDFEITDEKKESIDYPNDRMNNTVRTQTKNLLVNKNLGANDSFTVESTLTLTAGQYITVPATGTTIGGNGVKVSKIIKNVPGESMFRSAVGGCGDIFLKDITLSGTSPIFNLTDIDGTHAIEFNDVNFDSCTSLGTFNHFRQFTGTTCGFYSVLDGITLEGSWSGFKLTNSNIIGFGSTGTLFKKGVSTLFSNRFYIDLNLQISTGSIICDFQDSNFTNNKSLQVVNCYVKVNGVVDPLTTSITFPNISPFSTKAYFLNNQGIQNSRYVVPDAVNNNEAINLGQLNTTLSSRSTKGITSINLDGAASVYTIPHGLGQVPSWANATRGGGANYDAYNTTWDITNITLTYENPPTAGSQMFNWIALK